MEKFKCASFFAGIGGIDLAFEQTGMFEVIYANEKDRRAVITYEANNKKIKVDMRDIKDVMPEEVPDFDIAFAGFPCTDISYAGKKKGLFNEDGSYTRSGAFFEMLRIIHVKKPRVMLLENVRHLASQHKGETLKIVLSALEEEGYICKYKILDAREYGNTPQHRERIYFVCFLNNEDADKFSFPDPIPLTTTVSDVVDFIHKEFKHYYINRKNKGVMYDNLLKVVDGSRCVYYRNHRGGVYKCNPDYIPTITASTGNLPFAETKYGIRMLTPTECFIAQGFPEYFVLPFEINNCELYKQVGNTVCIDVVRRIAEQIAKAIS